MEILFLPLLVFVFVVVVIVLFNRLSTFKNKTDRSWQAYQAQLKKQQEFQDTTSSSINPELETARLNYNKKAAAYNRIIQTFPTSFMAAMAGYKEREIVEEVIGPL